MGQGGDVKLLQAVAYELGVPMGIINAGPNDTVNHANSQGTGGSITSDVVILGRVRGMVDAETINSPPPHTLP